MFKDYFIFAAAECMHVCQGLFLQVNLSTEVAAMNSCKNLGIVPSAPLPRKDYQLGLLANPVLKFKSDAIARFD